MAAKTSTYPARRRTLAEDIKNKTFRPVYLICGEEDYLRRQTYELIRDALAEGLNDMNLTRFQGSEVSEGAVIDLAQTLPFFADYRLILLEDTGLFKTGDHPLAEYFKDVPDTVRFIFMERNVDKRSKLYKAVEAAGLSIECDTPTDKDIATWIGLRFKKENRKVENAATEAMLARVGTDMTRLQQEIDKLIAYTEGRDAVTLHDVEAVCASWTSGQIFAMTDAIAEGNRARALELYYDLLALKEPPQRILFLITRQFRLMLQVKDMTAHHVDRMEQASVLSLQPFVQKKYADWAAGYSMKRLKSLLALLASQDEAVKEGRLNETIGVEMMIVEATNGDRTG